MNSEPVPGPLLWAATVPPCNSTRDFTRARPRPSPRVDCFFEPWQNRSNTRGSRSGAIPRPLSRTRKTTCPALSSPLSQMCPRGSVNLAALANKFVELNRSAVDWDCFCAQIVYFFRAQIL